MAINPLPLSRRSFLAGLSSSPIPFLVAQEGGCKASEAADRVFAFFHSGTAIPAPTYRDTARINRHVNPLFVPANAAPPPIYLDPEITYRVQTTTNGEVTEQDPFVAVSAHSVGYKPPASPAVSLQGYLDRQGITIGAGNEIHEALAYVMTKGTGQPIHLASDQPVYRIPGPISIAQGVHRIIGHGQTLDFSAISSGPAITITGFENPPYRQNSVCLRDLEIVGPGSQTAVDGIHYAGNSSGAGPSHLRQQTLNIHAFRRGKTFGPGSYLISHHDCDVWDCAIAIAILGGDNMGEGLRWFGGAIYNNEMAIESAAAKGANSCSSSFFGTSFDYNTKLFEIDGGVLNLFGCHQEATDYATVPIEISGNGSGLVVVGGRWLLAAPSAIPHWIDCGDECSAVFDKVMMHNVATTSGEFSTGVGHVAILGGGPSYEINAKPVVVNANYSRIADGSFEGTAIGGDIFISDDTAAITNRFTGANVSISISPAQARTGASSLKYSKAGGASTTSTFTIAAPVTPGGAVGGRLFHCKPGAQTGTLAFIYAFARFNTDGDGIPVSASLDIKGQNNVVFTSAATAWTELSFGASETWRAPPWATHFVVLVSGVAMDAGDIYFDDVSIDMIG